MLSLLGSFFTYIFAGGMTGLFGVAVQRFADFYNKKLDIEINRDKLEHELQLRKLDIQMLKEEWQARVTVADIEATAQQDVAESNAFAASFKEGPTYSGKITRHSSGQKWALVILDFIRGIVRPGLTVYLCVLTTLVYLHARKIMGGVVIDSVDAVEILRLIIGTILYLTTTCVLHYFGTRNKQKGPQL
jgi:hypothetical protein